MRMATGDADASRGYSQNKEAVLKRLRRIEGQVRGVERMVEEDRYCIDVVTQVTAIQAALTEELMGAVKRLLRRG